MRESEEGCPCLWPLLVQGRHMHTVLSGGGAGRAQDTGLFLVLPTQEQGMFSFPFCV